MLFSYILPGLVTFTGLYLLIRLRMFFVLHPLQASREFIDAARDRESRRSLFLALAGTLGVGNIFGVCAGLLIGGPGVVFWLLFSSIFSSVIKYAETVLTFDFLNNDKGMSTVLFHVFKKYGKSVSFIYSSLTVLLALFMGAAMQSKAVNDVAYFSLGLTPAISGILLLLFFLPCIIGGIRKIEAVTALLIPLTTIVYILMCFCVLLCNSSKIPGVIFQVFSCAFSPSSIVGGGVAIAIKEGFARGILSNEAGAGTSALAHSRAQGRSPHVAGLFAMSEVFFDTTLLCTLTALTVLVSVDDLSRFSSPMALIFNSFCSIFGDVGGYILLLLVLSFAYSTIICWYFYGMKCMSFIFPKHKTFFAVIFIGFLLFTSLISYEIIIYLTDYLLFIMSVFTLAALIKKSSRIAQLSKNKGTDA